MLLLFTEPRGQGHCFNVNISIQVSFGIHNSVCNIYYVRILVQGQRYYSAERRGPGAAGVVVHSLIHYVAFEKALSHSAV